MASRRTAVLMADNRPAVLAQPSSSTLTYPALAFALNAAAVA